MASAIRRSYPATGAQLPHHDILLDLNCYAFFSTFLRDAPRPSAPRALPVVEEMDRVFGGSGSCGTTGDPCGKDGPDCCDGYSCDGRDECRDDDNFTIGP